MFFLFNLKENINLLKELKSTSLYEPLFTKKDLLNFLNNKKFIGIYLGNKNYDYKDILENKENELSVACLLKKITLKEMKCLENIDSIIGSTKQDHENIFLVLKYLYNFWNEKVIFC